jgi:hypothetical protein
MNYTKEQIETLSNKLLTICRNILVNTDGSPNLYYKEGIYQDLLIHELNSLHYRTIRENVFNYSFKDYAGNTIYIGNNQCLRSDIELPDDSCILELKATSSEITTENLYQLRNYLEHRSDLQWGIVINFISKCTPKCQPKVQFIILYKNLHNNKYSKKKMCSEPYPEETFTFDEW